MEDMEDKTSRSMGQHLPLGVIPLIDFFNKLILDKHIWHGIIIFIAIH